MEGDRWSWLGRVKLREVKKGEEGSSSWINLRLQKRGPSTFNLLSQSFCFSFSPVSVLVCSRRRDCSLSQSFAECIDFNGSRERAVSAVSLALVIAEP